MDNKTLRTLWNKMEIRTNRKNGNASSSNTELIKGILAMKKKLILKSKIKGGMHDVNFNNYTVDDMHYLWELLAEMTGSPQMDLSKDKTSLKKGILGMYDTINKAEIDWDSQIERWEKYARRATTLNYIIPLEELKELLRDFETASASNIASMNTEELTNMWKSILTYTNDTVMTNVVNAINTKQGVVEGIKETISAYLNAREPPNLSRLTLYD